MTRIPTLIAVVVLISSCNNAGDRQSTRTKTAADSLMDQVMAGHNKAMAKVARLHETQTKLQKMIDSISKLPAPIQRNSAPYKMQLDSVLRRLKFADYAMDKWMNEFNMDSESHDMDKRMKYLQSEKTKISKVYDAITNSLENADSLAKTKF